MELKHSKSRLEGFSDAVFAFAATLLVVSLEVPETFSVLKEQLFGYIPFSISFLVLILVWKIHYNYFRRIDKLDNWIIGLNMLMTFTMLFFVYPLKFLINLNFNSKLTITSVELAELFQLYSMGFLLLSLSISLLYVRSSKIEIGEEKVRMLKYYARHFGIFVFVSLLSFVFASFKVGMQFGFPGMVFFLLGPLSAWHRVKMGYEKS
ncbi:MAG: putative membrane protein [Roseivirga sp.]|jgi:uncharacterized membrane protein